MRYHFAARLGAVLALFTLWSVTLPGCGREAPTYQPGSIAVVSVPEGGQVFLDGADTGHLTPATLVDLPPGRYTVAVVREGFVTTPVSRSVPVNPLETAHPDTFVLSRTGLSIASDPAGAEIFIDDIFTGEVTPAVIGGLEAGSVAVHVELDGFHHGPPATVTVVEGAVTEVPASDVPLRSRRTAMLEGFSNVDCAGCPDLALNVADLQHRDGYGLDRLLYVKYSLSFPGPHDPHTTPVQDMRAGYYRIPSIPAAYLEGGKITGTSANNTPTADELEPLAADSWAVDPGFLIDVTADFTLTDVPAVVTVTAFEAAPLAGKTLHVILAQSDVHYDTAPGSEGETDFHWIFRDIADDPDDLIDLAAGQTQTINVTLQRDDWDLDTLYVIAFVQDDADQSILQAGSTALDPALRAEHLTAKSAGPVPAGRK